MHESSRVVAITPCITKEILHNKILFLHLPGNTDTHPCSKSKVPCGFRLQSSQDTTHMRKDTNTHTHTHPTTTEPTMCIPS